MIRDVSNIGHHANGNAEISITEETFTKCINIIEQVIEKYSD
jgi:predicted transport protein